MYSAEQDEAHGLRCLERMRQAKTKDAFRKAHAQYFNWKSAQAKKGGLSEKRLEELDEEQKGITKAKQFEKTVCSWGESIQERLKNYALTFNKNESCRNIIRTNMNKYYYKNQKSFSPTDLKLYQTTLAKMDSIRGTRKKCLKKTPQEFMDAIDKKLKQDQEKTRVLSDSEYRLKSYREKNEEQFTEQDIARFEALIIQIQDYKKARIKPA